MERNVDWAIPTTRTPLVKDVTFWNIFGSVTASWFDYDFFLKKNMNETI